MAYTVKSFIHSKAFLLIFLFSTSIPLVGFAILYSQGFTWPDEIFQSIEYAHYLVTGRGFVAWEFEEQARSTLYPQLLSVWLRIVYQFTLDPKILFYSTRILLSLFFIYSMISVSFYYFAESNKLSTQDLITRYLLFLFIYVLFPLHYYFGFRTLSESLSTSLALTSIFILQLKIERKNFNLFPEAFILGLCYGIRFQMLLFISIYAICVFILLSKDGGKQAILQMLLGLLLGFWVYLLSDLISYGMPFISSINYYKANMIDNIGTNWGSSPFSFYFLQYSKYLSFLLVFLFPGLVAKWKSQYPIIIGTIFFVVLHSIIEHKELRFIYFTFPVLLYYIIEGIFVFYIFLKKYKNIFALSFVCLLTITSLSVNYNNVTKKIPWNFLNEILQLFLNAEENGLSGSSLVTINENYACGAGYVYLGRKYTDQLYFFKMSKYSFDFQKRLIEKKKIKNVLIWNTESEYYCKNFKFCETIWSIGNVSWKKRSL